MRKLPVEKRRNMPIVSTRLERAELSELDQVALQRGLSRSEFLRQAIQGAMKAQKRNEAALRLAGTSAQGMEVNYG